MNSLSLPSYFSLLLPPFPSLFPLHRNQRGPPQKQQRKMVPSLLLAVSLSTVSALVSYHHLHHPPPSARTSATSRASRCALFSTVGDEEAHLQGISVGIDLGTTNSAVAMMIPSDDGT